jgi:hypothetical protein
MEQIRRPETSVLNNLRRVITQKTEVFTSTAAKDYDLAFIVHLNTL